MTLHSIYYQMTDMENLDGTEEQKKSGYAAMREKHNQEMAAMQERLDAEIAGRAADKKAYFENTMKSRGYEGDFGQFADKYSSLDINDMVALYEGQNGKSATAPVPTAPADTKPADANVDNQGAKSVIAGANPTTEVGGKKLNEMNTEELLKFGQAHFGGMQSL